MTKDEVEAIDKVLRAACMWRSVVTETGHPKVYELAMAIDAYRRTMEPHGWPAPTLERLLAPAEPSAERAVHDAITRALAEAGVKQEVLVGMCIEVGLDAYRDALRTGAEHGA